jgi:hypothetical protein
VEIVNKDDNNRKQKKTSSVNKHKLVLEPSNSQILDMLWIIDKHGHEKWRNIASKF